MGVVAVDVDLGEHREGHAVVDLAELADLLLGAGLLAAELVAREAEHDEALVVQVLVERLEALVLGGEAAGARRVDDEDDLAGVVGEVALLAGQGRGGEVGECGHVPIVTRGVTTIAPDADVGRPGTRGARSAIA